jgi:acetyl esterase/lipase
MHGGGYVMGSYDSEDLRFNTLCPKLGVIGVSVDYRLAPEVPYPGPLNDCYASLHWVFDHAEELGIDPHRIGLFGTSAGGGLGAALAMMAGERGEFAPAFLLLLYPMLDDRGVTSSTNWEVPIWNADRNRFGWSSYLGDLYGQDVPYYAAPARAEVLAGLPPTSIWVGGCDIFCDESIEFGQRLTQAGVSTELHVYSDAPHGFDGIAPHASISRRCRTEMLAWLAGQMGESTGSEEPDGIDR